MFAAVCCWAIYTLGARPLMARHSPVGVTGMSMMIGTLMYLPLAWPSLRAVRWSEVSAVTWAALVYSAVFALCVSYTIWYAGGAGDRQRADVRLLQPRARSSRC